MVELLFRLFEALTHNASSQIRLERFVRARRFLLSLDAGLRFLLFTGQLVICLTILSCSNSEQAREQSQHSSSQRLRLTIGSSPATLDPHQITGSPGYKVVTALAEPLLSMDFNTFTVGPALAERWEQSEDGLTYRFFLRESARWSNGEPVLAQDFVRSFERIFSPRLGNKYTQDFFTIKNSEAFYSGELDSFKDVGVEALSEHILQVSLSQPDPLFLKKMAVVNSAPVHIKSVLEYGDLDDPANVWQEPGNYIGNGPFVLVDWQLNKRILLKKNPYYWDASAVKLEEIEFVLTESEAAEERLFRAGQIDLVYGGRVPTDKLLAYRREGSAALRSQTQYATYFYTFNTQRSPFDKLLVRKALAKAIDRQLLIDSILKNEQAPALNLTLAAGGYQPPQSDLGFDPVAARELLAQAGYPDGKGFPKSTILYNTLDIHRKLAVVIQQMWKRNLNIDVELENQEWKVFLQSRKSLQYDVARAGSFSTFGDPVDFLQSYTSGHGMNTTGWSNPLFDELVAKSNKQIDQEQRFKTLAQAEQLMLNDVPLLPIFYYRNSYLISPRVKGFTLNMADVPVYKGVYLETPSEAQ